MHYHYATGIPGYGPDGSDGFATVTSLGHLAEGLRSELVELASMLHDDANASADTGDFETAWHTIKRIESFDTLRANLDTKRSLAPLYRGKPELWAETLRGLIDQHFPLEVTSGLNLYAWQCDESDADCEHNDDE